ncbi:S-adenosyl-L-methionine-dependent methyltransferase [Patellaria atrata CBS 101060]|uniref:S-adenosyl-L-methionine-dependent methyltransferase n=1 Tax=Patellaria atrata CBS 101060 TaxID=1346257 RepID=A0A9P4VNX1_9PEZI|nr:S-adenosyl-L-methionine-dependent methyltransferase [Patellaria atrata CBS 101060]
MASSAQEAAQTSTEQPDIPTALDIHTSTQHIEVDENDTDSAFGEDVASSTTSLLSEVKKYQMENGRRYHGYQAGKYLYPNDEEELDRMDLENHLFNLLFEGKLFHAPVEDPQVIMDLGTGTGIWAMDVADQNPGARVIGIDLSPTQPLAVPPNLEFQIDDIEQVWTFRENFADLIHWRLLIGSINDYSALLSSIYRTLKPGGYIEIHDLGDPEMHSDDGTLREDSSTVLWQKTFYQAMDVFGRHIATPEDYKKWLAEAGFTDIVERIYKRPSNTWPKDRRMKEIGKFTCANMLEGYKAFSLAPFTRALGWSVDEVDILVAKARTELKDRSIHAYQNVVMLYARKPL